MTHDRSALCRDILDSLPDWFGRPQAVDRYVATAADQRMLACFSNDGTAIGFLSLHDHGPATTESSVWQRDDARWELLFHQGTPAAL